MHPRQDPDRRLLALADAQAGVVSLGQTVDLGLSRHSLARLLAGGAWQRLGTGIFHLGHQAPGWHAHAWAGLLLGGPQARLALGTAGHLWGLVEQEPRTVEVLVPAGRQVRDRDPWTFHRERPGARDPRSPGSPSRTTVEDTVLDLAEHGTPREVIGWVSDAVQQRLTTVPRLRRALRSRSRVRQRALLEALLSDVAEGAQSPLEVAYLRDVERAHGLPRADRQQPSRYAPHIRDVVYQAYSTVVELDGRRGHEGGGRFRDMHRDNLATVTGLVTLRFGHPDVLGDACGAALQVAAVLGRRGWNGLPTRCRHCRHLPLGLTGELIV